MDELNNTQQRKKTAEIIERYNNTVALEEAIKNMAHAQARVLAKKKFNTSNTEVIKKIATKLVPSVRQKMTSSDTNSFVKGSPIQNKGQKEYSESVNEIFSEKFHLVEFPQYDTSNAVGQKVDKPITSGTAKPTASNEKKTKRNKSPIIHYNKFGEERECESSVYKAITKKSKKTGISEDILGEVYDRGMEAWYEETGVTQQQYAFARINSFINKGKSYFNEDADLHEKSMKDDDPCWKGYEMVGTKKKGGKEVPNCVPVKEESSDKRDDVEAISRPQITKRGGIKNVERKPNAKLATDPKSAFDRENNIQKKVIEAKEEPSAEKITSDPNKPSSRFQGTNAIVKSFKKATPFAESLDESFNMAFDYQGKPTLAPTAHELMMKAQGGFAHHNDVQDVMEVTSIKKEIESAFQTTILEEDKEELALSYEKLSVMVAEAFQTIERIKSANVQRDAWSQAEILKLERYIESVAAYLSNVEEEVKAADRHAEVIPAHKRILTDPDTRKTTVVNVPGFTRSAPTEKKIIKSGNIRDGKPSKTGIGLGPA